MTGLCRPRSAAALLFLALAAPAGALVAQVPTVTLDEAVRRAQQVLPSVIQARGQVRNADAQVRSAWGAYLPSLTATTTGSQSFSEGQRINNTTGQLENANQTTESVNFGLNASVDLFTGFRRGADSRAAKATRTAAEATLTDQQFQAGLSATQQFFAALSAQQLVRVRETSVRRAEEQLALSTAKLRVGSATRSDSLRSVVNLGNARLQLIQSESEVARTQAALGRTLGLETRVAAADDSSYYQVLAPLDSAALLREALEHSPRVEASSASRRAAEAQLKASRSAYWPSLDLSASTNWSGTNRDDYQLFQQRRLSLGMSWPIFNRFSREQTIATRLSALDVAEANEADARREVVAALTTQFAALEAARVRIEITQASVLAATEDLRVVNERYRVGAATILDVLTSQEAVAQAEVDAVTARFDYLNARAQIEALIGRKL
jgi:outer membrane protein